MIENIEGSLVRSPQRDISPTERGSSARFRNYLLRVYRSYTPKGRTFGKQTHKSFRSILSNIKRLGYIICTFVKQFDYKSRI